jgi:hypothetical protein
VVVIHTEIGRPLERTDERGKMLGQRHGPTALFFA